MLILVRNNSLKKGYLAEANGSCWQIRASKKINNKMTRLLVSPAGINFKNSRSLVSSDFDLVDVQSAARSFYLMRLRQGAIQKRVSK